MHFHTLIISLASAAVLASALPSNLVARGGKGDGGYGNGGNGNGNSCQGGTVYCCNNTKQGGGGGGLLSFGDILGGFQCLGVLEIASNTCTSQTVCCNGNSDEGGLINVSCNNINL